VNADDFGGSAEAAALRALPGAGLPDALVFLDGADDGLLFGDGAGEGLFTINIFFLIGGFDGNERVPMVRHGEHEGVNVVAGHQLAVIVVGFAVFVAVMAVDLVQRRLQAMFV